MDNLRMLYDRLSTNLSIIKNKIALENKVNDQSINNLFESTIIRIFNIANNLNFVNANSIERNYPGIDGIDEDNKIMLQVTSTYSNEKIEFTIDQIIKHNLYSKFSKLVFIFLKDKDKKLTSNFIKKIDNKIDANFSFNLKNDIYDLNDIYQLLFDSQDIQKLLDVKNLLDDFLNFVPVDKRSGFEAISVTFHEEEIENVEALIDSILKEGINVYINSKRLYNLFKEKKHPLFDYIIYSNSGQNIDHIKYTIVVLSNSFINQNFSKNNKCILLQNAIENENKFFTICFDPYLRDLKKIRETQFNSYSSVQKETIEKKAKEILKVLFAESVYSTYSFNDIKEALINSYSSFVAKEIDDNKEYYLLNLNMEEQDDVTVNYLILKKDYIIQTVNSHFIERYSKDFSKNLNILVPKDFNHKTRRRLEIVRANFKNANKVFYIDEHLFDKSLKSFEQVPKLTIEDFIQPLVRINGELLRINDIINWIINNNESSIGIIKAAGGIGKTTVCEKIHDMIIQNFERYIVVFIDSNKYIEEFKKKRFSQEAEYDLYTIFKNCHPQGTKITRNSFFLNFSLGNIVIILDGIDEIISTIPSFNLNSFLAYLESLRANIGKGKILVNCRDTYIEDLIGLYTSKQGYKLEKIQIYQLLGFNVELAESYFSKHFEEKKKVENCKKLLEEFYPSDSQDISLGEDSSYKYHPFILEIIVQIVTLNFVYEDIEYDFNSELLLQNDTNDLLIYKILKREIFKKESHGFQLNVDEQIRFFCNIALEEKGNINESDFNPILTTIVSDGVKGNINNINRISLKENDFGSILNEMGLYDRLQEIKNGLLDHPLLTKNNGNYIFRFDFFNTYFKSIGIFNRLLTTKNFKISERFINVIAFECNANSVISKTICNKIINSEIDFKDLLTSSKDLFNDLLSFGLKNSNNILNDRRSKSISNLFFILSKVGVEKKVQTNELIKALFGNNTDEIKNFFLLDIPENCGVIFDLKNLYFSETKIKNFLDFFNCKFSEDTFFDETCEISDVYNKKIDLRKINATFNNFDRNIKGDNSIFKIIRQKESGNTELTKLLRDYLNSFFINRQIKGKLSKNSLPIFNYQNIKEEVITKILYNNKIIEKVENDIIYINKNFHSKLFKFIFQGISFLELNKALKELNSEIIKTKDIDSD